MKIAMPYQDGVLLEHFGRAKEFIIYNVSRARSSRPRI